MVPFIRQLKFPEFVVFLKYWNAKLIDQKIGNNTTSIKPPLNMGIVKDLTLLGDY